jgi:hypothetical protein
MPKKEEIRSGDVGSAIRARLMVLEDLRGHASAPHFGAGENFTPRLHQVVVRSFQAPCPLLLMPTPDEGKQREDRRFLLFISRRFCEMSTTRDTRTRRRLRLHYRHRIFDALPIGQFIDR